MEIKSLPKWLRVRLALSKKLKTKSKYGFQPILLPTEVKQLVKFFLLHLRVRAARHHPDHSNMKSHHPVWLKYTGEAAVDVSHFVTHFFESHMGTHTTPTLIRSLVETASHSAMVNNTITAAQGRSINVINGHTGIANIVCICCFARFMMSKVSDIQYIGAVCSDYYVRRSMTGDAHAGLAAFRSMTNRRDVTDDVTDDDDMNVGEMYTFPGNDDSHSHVQDDWGTQHPDYLKSIHRNAKFKWTEAEINYVGKWSTDYISAHPENSTMVIAKCLAALKIDSASVPIFHRSHILNTVRLRHGWFMYNKRKGITI